MPGRSTPRRTPSAKDSPSRNTRARTGSISDDVLHVDPEAIIHHKASTPQPRKTKAARAAAKTAKPATRRRTTRLTIADVKDTILASLPPKTPARRTRRSVVGSAQPARRSRSKASQDEEPSSQDTEVPTSSQGSTPRRQTRRRTRSQASVDASSQETEEAAQGSQESAPSRRSRKRTGSQTDSQSAEDAEEQGSSGTTSASRPRRRTRSQASVDQNSQETKPAPNQTSSGEQSASDSEAGADNTSGEDDDMISSSSSDSSDDAGSSDSDSDSDSDAELDHLVALSSQAVNAHSAPAPAVEAVTTTDNSEDAVMEKVKLVANMSFSISQTRTAGLGSGATYLRYGTSKGISGGTHVTTAADDGSGGHVSEAASAWGVGAAAGASGKMGAVQLPEMALTAKSEKATTAPLLNPKKRKRRDEKDTAGANWFDMPATTITPEIKRDLEIIRNRNYLDPKKFFKAADSKELPKHFQMGTVVASAGDFVNGRLTNKERQPTVAASLLADQRFKKYARRNYDSVTASRESGGKKAYGNRRRKRRGY